MIAEFIEENGETEYLREPDSFEQAADEESQEEFLGYLKENFGFDLNYNQTGGALDQRGGALDHFKIVSKSRGYNNKFKTSTDIFNLTLKKIVHKTWDAAMSDITRIFEQIHKEFVANKPNILVSIAISHDLLRNSIVIPLMKSQDLSVGLIQSYFEHVIQSYKKMPENDLSPNHEFIARVTTINIITGGSKTTREKKKKKCTAA